MARPKKTSSAKDSSISDNYFDKLEGDIKSNQSTLSLVLGALIVLVVGVLLFNYFSRNKNAEVGPSQTTQEAQGDVSPENLPGNYTVKEGDTLFTIAEKYYKDGYKYTEIATANKLTNVNTIEVGQVLDIPKLEAQAMEATPSTETTVSPSAQPEAQATPAQEQTPAIGGADTTVWGPSVKGDTYTVVAGDWLSTVAGRAYGDIMAYQKIAQANNITNPDVIEVGQVLKIPR